jgi:uncharacterized membrane-anchored protein
MPRLAFVLAMALALATPLAPAQESAPPPEPGSAPAPAQKSVPTAAPGSNPTSVQESAPTAEQEQQYLEWAKGLWDSLDRRHGKIELPGGVATLTVPESFYYLNPADAEKVLVEVWGNPPSSAKDTLGMLFPGDTTPFDPASWAVVIAYAEDGHVSDENADDIDYDALMTDMREATQSGNKERTAAGFEPIELIGWATKPHYDRASHKMYWAREIEFGDQPDHTLNYGIRVLGRKGVLELNFVAGMDQKETIAEELDKVLGMAEFEPGSRYEDFAPGIDKVAAYGIGALVAGKVLAKTGLFVAALVFLKKFWVLILAGLGGLAATVWRKSKKST